jgi:hypothetical protein
MPTFYRIVRSEHPGADEFRPKEGFGVPPPDDDPETMRLWSGVSVYLQLSQARRKARGRPWKGRAFIAALTISEDGPCRFERTTASRGHYTIWCDPDELLRCVVSVVPVSP